MTHGQCVEVCCLHTYHREAHEQPYQQHTLQAHYRRKFGRSRLSRRAVPGKAGRLDAAGCGAISVTGIISTTKPSLQPYFLWESDCTSDSSSCSFSTDGMRALAENSRLATRTPTSGQARRFCTQFEVEYSAIT